MNARGLLTRGGKPVCDQQDISETMKTKPSRDSSLRGQVFLTCDIGRRLCVTSAESLEQKRIERLGFTIYHRHRFTDQRRMVANKAER